jgi:hypothetical protein
MTYQQFDRLSAKEQTDLVWTHGVHLAERQEGRFTVILYQMDGFYIELFYTRHGKRRPVVRSFMDTDFLEPYLINIDVNEWLCW